MVWWLLAENGPYKVVSAGGDGSDGSASDGSTAPRLIDNPFSWNRNATYIMIDQPAGTGFSFVANSSCTAPTDGIASDQLEAAVRDLFRQFPEYAAQPLFISSESYGGHYVPELATRVVANNRAGKLPPLNLQGVTVGNGWVNPLLSSSKYGEWAYAHDLIGPAQIATADALFADCKKVPVLTD